MLIQKPNWRDYLPFAILSLALMILFHVYEWDLVLARQFYHSGSDGFYLRDNIILEKVLHKGGVKFVQVILGTMFLRLLYLAARKKRNQQFYITLYSFFSIITIIVTVSLLKQVTALPCPWNVKEFGGTDNFLGLLEMFNGHFSKPRCFPAGHASGGYSLIAYYFVLLQFGFKKRFSLLPGVIFGILFGFAQQLRGAHFFSHDMATLFIAVVVSFLMGHLYYRIGQRNWVAIP